MRTRRRVRSAASRELASTDEFRSLEPGRYVLQVTATWRGRGEDVAFHFAVEVTAPPDDVLVATLDAPDDGSMPDLTLAYGGASRDYIAQVGEWPGVDGFREPLLGFPAPIAPGTPLRVVGDADTVGAWVRVVDETSGEVGARTALDLAAGSLPTMEGVYQLEFEGTWSLGSAGYFVRVSIGAPTGSSEPPTPAPADQLLATLDAPDDGEVPRITLSYGSREAEYTACPGVWNGEQGVCTLQLDVFPGRIEPGTVLQVSGDADRVTGETQANGPDGDVEPEVPLDLDEGSAPLPTEPGTYTLRLSGTWSAGTAGLSVQITIGDPSPTTESPSPEPPRAPSRNPARISRPRSPGRPGPSRRSTERGSTRRTPPR